MADFGRSDTFDIRWGDTVKVRATNTERSQVVKANSPDIINVAARGMPRLFTQLSQAFIKASQGSGVTITDSYMEIFMGAGQAILPYKQRMVPGPGPDDPVIARLEYPAEAVRARFVFVATFDDADPGSFIEVEATSIVGPTVPYAAERRTDYAR